MSPSVAERVTMMPVAVESSRAGIWETRPSPMVSSEKVLTASAGAMPRWITPMPKPPMRLIIMTMMPAMASPLTNLLAPSIEP